MNSEEIDLDDDEIQEVYEQPSYLEPLNEGGEDQQEEARWDDQQRPDLDQDPPRPATSTSSFQNRLHNLKLKINQAKQLNLKEVTSEGERLGSEEGIHRFKRDLQRQDKARKNMERQHVHAKLIATHSAAMDSSSSSSNTTTTNNINSFTQMASESLYKAHVKAEKAALASFSSRDYHNPEGQFRNYQNNVKAIKHVSASAATATATADNTPISNSYYTSKQERATRYEKEREGASRVSMALQERYEKTIKKKTHVKHTLSTQVNHINKKNMLFNQKISKDYDAHTAEIRQNLERGTAL